MKYKGTRQLLTGILAVMLTIPVIVGLASPIRTQAASKVGVQYRFADGAEQEAKNRVGIRSVVIDGKTYFDIHDGSKTGRTESDKSACFFTGRFTEWEGYG